MSGKTLPSHSLAFIHSHPPPFPPLSCGNLSLCQCLVGTLALFQIISLSAAILQSDRAAALKRQRDKLTQLTASRLHSGLHPTVSTRWMSERQSFVLIEKAH